MRYNNKKESLALYFCCLSRSVWMRFSFCKYLNRCSYMAIWAWLLLSSFQHGFVCHFWLGFCVRTHHKHSCIMRFKMRAVNALPKPKILKISLAYFTLTNRRIIDINEKDENHLFGTHRVTTPNSNPIADFDRAVVRKFWHS